MQTNHERKTLNLLDPDTLSRIKNLSVRARYIVEGYLTGLHRSPFHGFSIEFTEHREYQPGDPIRHLDWKVLAKRDKYYVKRYEEETNLRAMFLLDISRSMDYATGGMTKLEYAQTCAAGLGYLMHTQRDRYGLITFNSDVETRLDARSGKEHFFHFIQALEKLAPADRTNAKEAFRSMMKYVTKRSLVMLFTDFLNGHDDFITGLKNLRSKRLEVIVFHIMDPAEWSLPFNEYATFTSPEDKMMLPVNPHFLRNQYKQEITAFCGSIEKRVKNMPLIIIAL